MAKRRSMNRRWSRRSGNNSAFLNDDTNIMEEDSGYWQYLNQTNTRGHSEGNLTTATEVLNPDSNLMDSDVSASQYALLRKSIDTLPGPSSGISLRSPGNDDNVKRNPPDDVSVTESEASNQPKKRRLQMKKVKPSQDLFAMDSSASEEPTTSELKQKIAAKSIQITNSLQDSDTSAQSAEVRKKRPIFRKSKNIFPRKSLDVSANNSVVVNSQDSSKTSIKPRSTYLRNSSEKIDRNLSSSVPRTSENESSSSEELTSQPRNIFRQLKRTKPTHNPFFGILEDIEDSDGTENVVSKQTSQKIDENQTNVNKINKSKSTNDDSKNFELRITPELPKDKKSYENYNESSTNSRQMREVSDSSISEELIVSQNRDMSPENEGIPQDDVDDDDFRDDHSLKVSKVQGDTERSVKKSKTDKNADRDAGYNDENDDLQENNEESQDIPRKYQQMNEETFRTSRFGTQKVQISRDTSNSEESVDKDVIYKASHPRTQLEKSILLDHTPSPTISGLISQHTADEDDSSVFKDKPRRTRILRSKIIVLTESNSSQNATSSKSEQEQLIGKRNSKSIPAPSSESLRRPSQSEEAMETDSEGEVDSETRNDDKSSYTLKGEQDKTKLNISKLLRSSKVKSPTQEKSSEVKQINRPGPKSSKTPGKTPAKTANKTPKTSINISTSTTSETPTRTSLRTSLRSSAITTPRISITPLPKTSSKTSINIPEISPNESQRLSISENSENHGDFRKSTSFKRNQDESLKTASQSSKFLTKRISTSKHPTNQPNDSEPVQEERISRRPGPKSFKLSQKSLLSSSHTSVAQNPMNSEEKTQNVLDEVLQNETEILFNLSTGKNFLRQTRSRLYELPDRQRSPSISGSESENEKPRSATPFTPRRQTRSATFGINSPIKSPSISKTFRKSAIKSKTLQNIEENQSPKEEVSPSVEKPAIISKNTDECDSDNVQMTTPSEGSMIKSKSAQSTEESSSEDEEPHHPNRKSAIRPHSSYRTEDDVSHVRISTALESLISSRVFKESMSVSKKQEISKDNKETQLADKNTLVDSAQISKKSKTSLKGTSVRPSSGNSNNFADSQNENRLPLSPKPSTSFQNQNVSVQQKTKLRQLKLDHLLKLQKSQTTKSPDSDASMTEEEMLDLKKKLAEIHKKHIEAREHAEAQKPKETKPKEVPRKKFTFKCDEKPKKPKKPIHPAYIVNGKVYKPPKRPRKRTWATDRLYAFLDKKMEPKFGLATRRTVNEFVEYLVQVEKFIMRQKSYDKYKAKLKQLHRKMASLGIIKTRFDFIGFCNDYMLKEFRYKIIPIWQPGNDHTIPFEPDKLHDSILSDTDED